MTLTILGNSHDGESLWFSTDEGETDVTPAELADARSEVARSATGFVRVGGIRLDESDVTSLIGAMIQPQPFYPLEACEDCDSDATHRIEGRFYCDGHAGGFLAAEDESRDRWIA